MDIERTRKKIGRYFDKVPVVKHALKRVFQLTMFALSREKIKVEGDVRRVTPVDDFEYFYGYYDKSPWDASGRYMICIRVKQAYKSVAPKERGEVVLVDTKNENIIIKVGKTDTWNVQQACMAQWLGPEFKSRLIYNDFRGGKYCSVIFNVEKMKEERELPMPVYDVSRNGKFALTLDFSRLHRLRPGYGYSNLKDETQGELCPDKTCIWRMELEDGKITPLLTYKDISMFEHTESMDGAEHKVNHLMISPNGERFMVLHRWFKNGLKTTRLVTCNTDGTDLYNLSDDGMASHSFWKNDKEILSFLRKKDTGDHYYLMKDKTQDYRLLWPELYFDGHCSYSPDRKYVITDCYPNSKRIAAVYLCSEDGSVKRIARVFSAFRYDNDCRCDLHPRWRRDCKQICIDSVHEGKRALYVIPLEKE